MVSSDCSRKGPEFPSDDFLIYVVRKENMRFPNRLALVRTLVAGVFVMAIGSFLTAAMSSHAATAARGLSGTVTLADRGKPAHYIRPRPNRDNLFSRFDRFEHGTVRGGRRRHGARVTAAATELVHTHRK